MVEQVTKEKDDLQKHKMEALASLEDSRRASQKLQKEVTQLNISYTEKASSTQKLTCCQICIADSFLESVSVQ